MRRRAPEIDGSRRLRFLVLLFISLVAFFLFYLSLSSVKTRSTSKSAGYHSAVDDSGIHGDDLSRCCKGVEKLELWGPVVTWGNDHKFNTSEQCCEACRAMCSERGQCSCNSWVFCGDREKCGEKFGECWLKKQNDILDPEKQLAEQKAIWTSGLVSGKQEGIIYLETQYGNLHIKLYPECAPHSVLYITELLKLRHCVGCHLYRAENRGEAWNSEGNHVSGTPFGPPFALIQGTLGAENMAMSKIPKESCLSIRRGSVGWVGSGPEFFISLANHDEWRKVYTVFGSVLAEDMEIAEKIAQLPTKKDVWNNIEVQVLENLINLRVKRDVRSL